MTITSVEDILEHYGVKGMKWGVRKDQSSSSKPQSKNTVKRTAKAATNATKWAGNKASESVKKKLADEQAKVDRGKKFAKTLMKASGPYQVAKLGSKVNGKKAAQTILKVSGPYQLAKIAPKVSGLNQAYKFQEKSVKRTKPIIEKAKPKNALNKIGGLNKVSGLSTAKKMSTPETIKKFVPKKKSGSR